MQRLPRRHGPEEHGRKLPAFRCVALVSLMAALAVAACSEPLTFPAWTVPIPDGTPVHEFRFVPVPERSEHLVLERDLVISEGMGRGLYRPSAVAVAADGTIFVLDDGNYRVVAFDQSGNALREFGHQGQGPGEFQRPGGFGVADDLVVIEDTRNNRLVVFTRDGELVSDSQFDDRLHVRELAAADDALLMIVQQNLVHPFQQELVPVPWMLARYSTSGERLAVVAQREAAMKAYLYTDSLGIYTQLVCANPIGVIRPDSVTYLTNADEYQILAIDAEGGVRWALRTTFTAAAITEAHKEESMQEIVGLERPAGLQAEVQAELAHAKGVWPERFAALENIETDGHGNLYAFPYAYRSPGIDPGPEHPVAVDVYSPSGDPLFSGLATFNDWNAAFGEFIYRIEEDPVTGEQVVARYRVSGYEP